MDDARMDNARINDARMDDARSNGKRRQRSQPDTLGRPRYFASKSWESMLFFGVSFLVRISMVVTLNQRHSKILLRLRKD